jgi:hypothetical protein
MLPAAKGRAAHGSTRRWRAYATVPEIVLAQTTASVMLVMVRAGASGKNAPKSGTNRMPLPNPRNVP